MPISKQEMDEGRGERGVELAHPPVPGGAKSGSGSEPEPHQTSSEPGSGLSPADAVRWLKCAINDHVAPCLIRWRQIRSSDVKCVN